MSRPRLDSASVLSATSLSVSCFLAFLAAGCGGGADDGAPMGDGSARVDGAAADGASQDGKTPDGKSPDGQSSQNGGGKEEYDYRDQPLTETVASVSFDLSKLEPSTPPQPVFPPDNTPVDEKTGIAPFTPPSLEDLKTKLEWEEMPVVDTLQKWRAFRAAQGKPLATIEEAKKLKNDSPANNAKIVSAFGELAPEDGAGVDYEAVFSQALTLDLRSINPLLASSVSEFEVGSLIGFGLFGIDWNMKFVASKDSVVSWRSSKDRMVDVVVMRDDLTWSDGKPITAHDIVFSWRTIVNPDVPVPAQKQGTDQLRWVHAYDDRTVAFFHKAPLATHMWNINFSIIPKHVYEHTLAADTTLQTSAEHQALEKKPVVGGSYELASWQRGQEIVLRRRDSAYTHQGKQVRDKPYFKEVRYRIIEDANTRRLALQTGRIEVGEIGAEDWVDQTSGDDFYKLNTKVSASEWTYFYIGWNLKRPFFADRRARLAMSHAINHDEILNDLNKGLYQQCRGTFHPASPMYPAMPRLPLDRFNKFDLDLAEDLLDAAGWKFSESAGARMKEVDGKPVKFEFDLMVSSKPDRIRICNLVAQDLKSIGVLCNVRPIEAATMQDRMFKKDYDAAFSGWGAGADPNSSENIFATGQDRNSGGYSNPDVDKLFKLGMEEFNEEKRMRYYAMIHEIIYSDQPYTFLFNRSSFYGFNKRLRGFNYSPRGPFGHGPGFGAVWAPVNP